MTGFGIAPKDDDEIPIAQVFVPDDTLRALQGSTNTSIDGSGRVSTPANFNLSQIGSVTTQMMTADGVAQGNIPEFGVGIFTFGNNVDRWRAVTNIGDGSGTGAAAVGGNLYNNSTWDRQRGNIDSVVLLASGAVTTNSNSADLTNFNHRGVKVYIKTGSFGASESTMVVKIRGKDPVSTQYFDILTSVSLSASSFVVLTVYPGLTASANVAANDVIPRTWRVEWSASNWGTGGSTLGIACAYML